MLDNQDKWLKVGRVDRSRFQKELMPHQKLVKFIQEVDNQGVTFIDKKQFFGAKEERKVLAGLLPHPPGGSGRKGHAGGQRWIIEFRSKLATRVSKSSMGVEVLVLNRCSEVLQGISRWLYAILYGVTLARDLLDRFSTG